MNWDANHAGFVLASYALTGLVVAGLIAWILSKDRALKRRMAEHDNSSTKNASHDR